MNVNMKLSQLDHDIRGWLDHYVQEWDMPVEQVALVIRIDEIANRLRVYPEIAASLARRPIDINSFADVARQSWVLGHRMDAIRFNEFVSQTDKAANAIEKLLDSFPEDDKAIVERIDEWLETIVKTGYVKSSGSHDWAGAAQLASLILTSVYPKKFVDFRPKRWYSLAGTFGYEILPSSATYGEKLVWAGDFAKDISQTQIYKEYWPEGEPLWVISGICWKNTEIEKPETEPTDIDILAFPEGSPKRRLHLLRERNQTVVAKAKALGLREDLSLQCQVCGFSYVETYGERGRGFIEAHHKKPVAELTPGSKTRVSDIGLVCANCHRMLHRGDRTLSIEELRVILLNR